MFTKGVVMSNFIAERVCFYSSMFPHSSSAYEISALADKLGAAGVELMNFCTELKTPDMKTVILPNGGLSNQNLTNYSDTDKRRVDFEIGAGYSADPEKVKEVLTRIALSFENVDREPAPFAGLKGYGDSSVNYTLRVWCDASEYWNVYFAINEAIIKEFNKENIEIPFPQMDVHMK